MHTDEITLAASTLFLFAAILMLAIIGAISLGVVYGRRHAPDDDWKRPPQSPEIDMKATAQLVPCEDRPAQPPRPPLEALDHRLAVPHNNIDILPATSEPTLVGVPCAAPGMPQEVPVERSWVSMTLWGGKTVTEMVDELQANADKSYADYRRRYPYRGAMLLM